MAAPHYRKIELQSLADFTYLYTNTVSLSRRKLDLHLPPSATNTADPMRERVRELVDEYIHNTFSAASSSISINGLDSSSPQFPFPASFTTPETVEYEAFDGELAARVTALYAQLESLTTNVAQLRREAPGRAATEYAAQLTEVITAEEQGPGSGGDEEEEEKDVEGDKDTAESTGKEVNGMDVDKSSSASEKGVEDEDTATRTQSRSRPEWTLQLPPDSEQMAERWRSGDMAEVYENALRTLLRLQGEGDADSEMGDALATTVGKAERAARAADVVENM